MFRFRTTWTGCIAACMGGAVLLGCEPPVVSFRDPSVRVVEDAEGSGRRAMAGSMVTIAYEVRLPDGEVVISDERYEFELGSNAVIPGIDMAVQGMRIGGRRTIQCPPQLHWGRRGYAGEIPPNTTLTIDIELLRVR